MLKSVVEFFRKEKGYGLLTLLVIGIVIYLFVFPSNRMKKSEDSPAVVKFKAAEQHLQEKVKTTGSVQEYIKEHPELSEQVSALSLAFVSIFILGLVLNGLYFFSGDFRAGLTAPRPIFETTPWRLSMIYKVVLLFIFMSFATGLALAFLRHVTGAEDNSVNFYILLHTTLMDVICFLLIKKVVTDGGGSWRELGFRLPEGKPLKEIFFAWGAYAAVLPAFVIILSLLMFIANVFHYDPPAHPLVNVFLEEEVRGKPLILYSIFLATVIGPVFEEIFFRGFCYTILKNRFGITAAMIVSSAFFALIHENSFAFWPIFVLGLILCWVYEKRSSLLAPMALHITHNAIFIYYFFIAKQIVHAAG